MIRVAAPTTVRYIYASRSTGKERDTESGLDYFGARYYASNMGRFLSPDWSANIEPIPYSRLNDPQSMNLYAYVRNNPLNQTDPDGHSAYSDWAEQNDRDLIDSGNYVMNSLPNLANEQGGQNMAQQQSGSTVGTGFWGHVGNLLHGHSWNFGMRESGIGTIVPEASEPDGYATAASDIGSIVATAGNVPKAGYVISILSLTNDPSPENWTLTGLGLIPRLEMPATIIPAEADLFNWQIQQWASGASKAEAIKAGQRNTERGYAPSAGELAGDCPLNMCD